MRTMRTCPRTKCPILRASHRSDTPGIRLRALWGNFPVVVRVHSGAFFGEESCRTQTPPERCGSGGCNANASSGGSKGSPPGRSSRLLCPGCESAPVFAKTVGSRPTRSSALWRGRPPERDRARRPQCRPPTDAATPEVHGNAIRHIRVERRRSVTDRRLYALRQQHLPLSAGVDSALAVVQSDE